MSFLIKTLLHYPEAVASCDWVPLGSAGGFSGSQLWRGDRLGVPQFALKCWLAEYPASRLKQVHRWMEAASALPLVPKVMTTSKGETVVESGNRVWDVTTWMPGKVDNSPNEAKLLAACDAVQLLHRIWKPHRTSTEVCPAVLRRWKLFEECESNILRDHLSLAKAALVPWLTRLVPVQPCLCDVHREHVLFTGDEVSGIIDYGAMKIDHPAVDAARLLGDLVPDDLPLYRLGLGRFENPELIRVLDYTGRVGAVIYWLRRKAIAELNEAEERRFRACLAKLESCTMAEFRR
jgi:hypothetical protein